MNDEWMDKWVSEWKIKWVGVLYTGFMYEDMRMDTLIYERGYGWMTKICMNDKT